MSYPNRHVRSYTDIELRQPADQARAHDGLAHVHRVLNQTERAREHWQQALNILTSLGTSYTEDLEASTTAIRAHLATVADR